MHFFLGEEDYDGVFEGMQEWHAKYTACTVPTRALRQNRFACGTPPSAGHGGMVMKTLVMVVYVGHGGMVTKKKVTPSRLKKKEANMDIVRHSGMMGHLACEGSRVCCSPSIRI